MNVLLLNHELTPLGGGAGRATHHIASHLVKLGHSVRLVTANANGTLPREETRAGYHIFRVPGFRKASGQNRLGPTFLSYLLAGRTRAAELIEAERPDVIHAFFTIPAGLVGRRLQRTFGVPLVVSLRGSDVPGYDESKRMVRRLKFLIRHVWRRADAVVALSEGLLTLARQTDPLPGALAIHNGVHSEDFPVRAMESRPADAPVRFLSVARLERFKGLDVLLQAFAGIIPGAGSVALRIVGDGPQRGALEALVQQLRLHEVVTFAGNVPPDEMAREYAAADCLVHPALNEAFGQVLTEAMSCGLPILATRTGGIPEIVHEGKQGWLIPPGDAGALSAGLRRVATLPARERNRIGLENAAYVRAEFDWSKVAEKYLAVYEQVTAKRGRG